MTNRYQNFDVAIYCRAQEVAKMEDLAWLRQSFEVISSGVKVSKVYLETHRDWFVADEKAVLGAKRFFEERGIQTAGGITITVNEPNRFQTYCYTNPEHREKLKGLAAYTARMFDELILDDFFFTNCKCESCIQAKGSRSWTRFRLDLMTEAATELIIKPAKAANPKVKVVIKYPNWYEHFQGLGFDLERGPALFDGIYTGTETRDAVVGNQHLQPYHGYSIMRYFENIKPGGNGGGWVDPFASLTPDRYAEQLWMTLFSKTREITLFDFRSVISPFMEPQRGGWQGQGTSFDYDSALAPAKQPDGSLRKEAIFPLTAGAAFESVDCFLGELGQPVGVPVYKPYHSHGEDFLPSYLGMLGIPVDVRPDFPVDAPVVILTEASKFDQGIVEKIEHHVRKGNAVVITSGLLRALQDRGIHHVAELEVSDRRTTTNKFLIGWSGVFEAEKTVTVPQVTYFTNDSWEEISCMGGVTGCPLLHSATYGKGVLYVLAVPDNFGDLYHLPVGVLSKMKEFVAAKLPARLEAPAQVALFLYDNDTLIVESFLDENVEAQVVIDAGRKGLRDILTGEEIAGEERVTYFGKKTGVQGCPVTVKAHSFRVFKLL